MIYFPEADSFDYSEALEIAVVKTFLLSKRRSRVETDVAGKIPCLTESCVRPWRADGLCPLLLDVDLQIQMQ